MGANILMEERTGGARVQAGTPPRRAVSLLAEGGRPWTRGDFAERLRRGLRTGLREPMVFLGLSLILAGAAVLWGGDVLARRGPAGKAAGKLALAGGIAFVSAGIRKSS